MIVEGVCGLRDAGDASGIPIATSEAELKASSQTHMIEEQRRRLDPSAGAFGEGFRTPWCTFIPMGIKNSLGRLQTSPMLKISSFICSILAHNSIHT